VSGANVVFRIAYARYSELRDDVTQQMARGGLLVKVHDASGLTLDTPVQLELVLPDGRPLYGQAQVIQVLAGFGVAVSVGAELVDQARQAAAGRDRVGAGDARHERIFPDGSVDTHDPAARLAARAARALSTPPIGLRAAEDVPSPRTRSPSSTPPPSGTPRPSSTTSPPLADGPTRAEKIHKALYGSRDERNAILRDRDRTLHPFVLKNPQLNGDDVIAIAKNAQMMPDLLKQIGERKDWVQRPAVALALARNPKTPAELALRALEFVPLEALRQMAKGTGVLPHVAQAARKRVIG
jgi:hypothetical protein